MKFRILSIAIALLSCCFSIKAATDKDGHKLVSLWEEYYRAEEKDRLQDMISSLAKIKEEASEKHIIWDYFDSCRQYSEAVTRGNWKLREEQTRLLNSEFEAFGEPVILFFNRRYDNLSGLLSFVNENKAKLEGARNPEFYKTSYELEAAGALVETIRNDYDYALWCIYLNDRHTEEALKERYSKEYSLMERSRELMDSFNRMDEKRNTPEEYRRIYDECLRISKDSFGGTIESVKSLIKRLEQKDCSISVEGDTLVAGLRNLGKVTLTISSNGKTVYENTVTNPKGSFYVPDTVKVELPKLDDGEYGIVGKSGSLKNEFTFNRHSLSIATRQDSKGLAFYVAESVSGKPLDCCTLKLTDASGKVRLSAENIHLEKGFTAIPANFEKDILMQKSWNNRIVVEAVSEDGRKLMSSPQNLSVRNDRIIEETMPDCAVIITDRAAYNPGETLHFKAVLYRGTYSMELSGKGVSVTARLVDSGSRVLGEKELATNDFGSVSGDFLLTGSDRGGYYRIQILLNGQTVASKGVRVDEFEVPTFTVLWEGPDEFILPLDELKVKGNVKAYSGHNISAASISYRIESGGISDQGAVTPDSNGDFMITLPLEMLSKPDFINIIVKVTDATGETKQFYRYITLRRAAAEPVNYFFERVDADGPAVKVTAGNKKTWIVAELFGPGDVLLEHRLICAEPVEGVCSTVVGYKYKDSYPDLIELHLIYFQNSRCYSYSVSSERKDKRYELPLSFTRFLDTVSPASHYVFSIKTGAGVECAAGIYDIATDEIASNVWNEARPEKQFFISTHYSYTCGRHNVSQNYILGERALMKSAGAAVAESYSAVAEDNIAVENSEAYGSNSSGQEEYIRENFANTIAWEPVLRSDGNGDISFGFDTADKLSTYCVQLFAHDRNMRNAVIRQKMLVTVPVKVAVVEPRFLYENDILNTRISLSNSLEKDVEGVAGISFIEGNNYKTGRVISSVQQKTSIPAKGNGVMNLELKVPESLDSLGIMVKFNCEGGQYGSDALFVCIPIRKPVQTITESHSALLTDGEDKGRLEASLRGMFTGVSGDQTSVKEISIRKILLEAIPEKIEPESDNLLSLIDALHSNALLEKLGVGRLSDEQKEQLQKKILECVNPDGGFSWFKGMESSAPITATVLQRMKAAGLEILDSDRTEAAVRFLDKCFFDKGRGRFIHGGLSLSQYASVRSSYAGISFDSGSLARKDFSEFRKNLKSYLLPSKRTGLDGQVLAKIRRFETLENLSAAKELGRKWGITSQRKIQNMMADDIESIRQYSQPHKSGGWYYPNAVMPWRGLMESELFAHVELCRLLDRFDSDISNGIRLWIMVQKETQNWKQDPAYIDALSEVLRGPESILNTEVLALSATYTVPFKDIRAAGNGLSIERRYFRYTENGKTRGDEIKSGDILRTGEIIRAEYRCWSEENRSFVLVRAPHPACLRPVNQLSSCYGSFYRNVKADRTEYWYESFPEENFTISEDFYVTQEGEFQTEVATVESLYAPHYRANEATASETTKVLPPM